MATDAALGESLKSLRFLHQLLLVATAVVLVLGLASDPSKTYRLSLNELDALRQIQPAIQDNAYAGYLRARAGSSAVQDGKPFVDLIQKAGAHVDGRIEIERPIVVNLTLTANGTLQDFVDFFQSQQQLAVVVVVPQTDSFDRDLAVLKKQLKINDPTRPPHFDGFRVNCCGRTFDGTLIEDPRNIPALFRNPEYLTLEFSDPQSEAEIHFGISLEIGFRIDPLPQHQLAMDWLRSLPSGRILIDEKTQTVLPQLRRSGAWTSISVKNITDATLEISQRLDSVNAGVVSFFGISVPRTLALIAGPAVTLGLLLFFRVHFLHFESQATGVYQMVRAYPWVVLFPGPLSAAASHISIAFLPMAVNILLISRYAAAESRSAWPVGIGTVLCLAIMFVSVKNWLTIRAFRRAWWC